jgi:hypothetical protein
MSRTATPRFRWSRLLPFTLGAFAIVGLVLCDGHHLVAQAKKEAKSAKSKTGDDEGAPKKVEVKYVPQIPPVTDQLFNSGGVKQVNKINELIKANWLANKVNPSERCTDYEFIRRASLDIIGRIATEKEIVQFMKHPASTRRSWLVENLLRSPEYAENLANIWTTMLLTRSGSQKLHQEQLREWLIAQFKKGGDGQASDTAPSVKGKGQPAPTQGGGNWSKIVMELLTATGKSNDTTDGDHRAVNFIAHHIGEEIRQDESKKGRASEEELKENGRYDMVPITSRTTKLFLGIRTQCVQCHDHPTDNDRLQGQFWGINAFFRQTTVSQRPGTMAPIKKKNKEINGQIIVSDEKDYNVSGLVSFETRKGLLKYTGMKFLDGTRVKTIPAGSSRRHELAKLVVDHPNFSKVFVNRTWAHFFGKSFTPDAPDDFGDHNPATNPELLDFLADEFKAYNYNTKDLIRWICNSQAYGLSSKTNKTNDKPDDDVFFARMLLKPMSPEQLFDSMMTATTSGLTPEHRQRLSGERDAWLNKLVLNFGNDEGEEGTFSGTVVQALMLMNGDEINKAIMDPTVGTVAYVIAEMKTQKGAQGLRITMPLLNKLYLATLNRPVTQAEFDRISDKKMWLFHNPAVKSKVNPNSEAFAIGYYQDIFWALLNSNEFILNH